MWWDLDHPEHMGRNSACGMHSGAGSCYKSVTIGVGFLVERILNGGQEPVIGLGGGDAGWV